MAEDKKREAPEPQGRGREEMSEAEIDHNLAGTFPASDPPSWTLGMEHQREPATPAAEPVEQGEGE
jgi:hypothetical protein